jgi:hypothetical protein
MLEEELLCGNAATVSVFLQAPHGGCNKGREGKTQNTPHVLKTATRQEMSSLLPAPAALV